MGDYFLKLAEAWCHCAYLRTEAVRQEPGFVEEALGYAMFYLWAAEVVDDA